MAAYLIVLEVTPMRVPSVHDSLPLHCTLVHWFWADVSPRGLAKRLRRVTKGAHPIPLIAGRKATFRGKTKTGLIAMLVDLVEPTDALVDLHEKVCQELDKLSVRYSMPEYVKKGFNPHVTRHHSQVFQKDQVYSSPALYLIQAEAPEYGNARRIVAKVRLETSF